MTDQERDEARAQDGSEHAGKTREETERALNEGHQAWAEEERNGAGEPSAETYRKIWSAQRALDLLP